MVTRLYPLMGLMLGVMACKTSSDEPHDTDKPGDTDTDDGLACADIQGEGYGKGDISMDWTLQDVNGKSVSLYDYCGQVVYIEDTTAW